MSLPLTADDGTIQTSNNGTPVSWNAGLGYDAAGKLCITSTTSGSDSFSGGHRVDAQGRLVVTSTGSAPFDFNAGWPSDKVSQAVQAQLGPAGSTVPSIAGVAVNQEGIFVSEGASPRVAAPVFSPSAPGNFLVDTAITITSATPGATIRYTTNGTTPSATVGIIYSGPVLLTALTTLQAIAYNGAILDSSVTSGTYQFDVQMPTFFPVSGVYATAQTVTIASPTDSNSIRYTTDGTDPTPTVGTVYTVPINVAVTQSVRAIAYKPNWNSSPIGVGNYSIGMDTDFALTSDNLVDFLTADSGIENLVTDLSPSSGPPYVGLWNYSTPPNATIPNAGEIIHGDNFLGKLNVSVLDAGGNVLDLAQITTGDTIEFNSFLYTVQAPAQMFSGYAAIAINPEVQQPDGAYTVTTSRP